MSEPIDLLFAHGKQGMNCIVERQEWRLGLAWKSDKFYRLDAHSILVMHMWPEMLAWRRTSTRPWSPTRKWADRLLCEPFPRGLAEVATLPRHLNLIAQPNDELRMDDDLADKDDETELDLSDVLDDWDSPRGEARPPGNVTRPRERRRSQS